MKKKYRSKILASVHESAEGLFAAGIIDKATMKTFNESCLTPVEKIEPAQIRALRDRENVSQSVFARHLNVSINLVSQWERGEKKPQGSALKLLSLIMHKGLSSIA